MPQERPRLLASATWREKFEFGSHFLGFPDTVAIEHSLVSSKLANEEDEDDREDVVDERVTRCVEVRISHEMLRLLASATCLA